MSLWVLFCHTGDLLGSFGMPSGSILEALESSGMPLGSILLALGLSGALPGDFCVPLVSFGLAREEEKVLK